MKTRREFIAGASAAAATAALGASARRRHRLCWAMYNQLGSNMWNMSDPLNKDGKFCGNRVWVQDAAFDARTEYAAKNGIDTLVIELAEALAYPSHPELWIRNDNPQWSSRSAEWMNAKVRRARELGVEMVPTMNFSTTHDAWLGHYERMISSPAYYQMLKDLFKDVNDIFEKPRLIGFGMDEENCDFAAQKPLAVYRQGELLWHDINFMAEEIEKLGARSFMAADLQWWYPEEYLKKVSKSILQVNWYYSSEFDYTKLPHPRNKYVKCYHELDKAGFEQYVGPSNFLEGYDKRQGKTVNDFNIPNTLEFARTKLSEKSVKGVLCYPWCGAASPGSNKVWFDAVDQLVAARAKFYPEEA